MAGERPALVIVMGASGCGKSTVGLALAELLECPFIDGDDLHPDANVEKMSRGTPLTDEDRIPWLRQIRATAILVNSSTNPDPDLTKIHPETRRFSRDHERRKVVVCACSALKKSYRDILRGRAVAGQSADESDLETFFVYLHGSRALLYKRMEQRKGHFMKSGMLESQLATLEPPSENDEDNIGWVELGEGKDEAEAFDENRVGRAAMQIAVERWRLGSGELPG